MCQTHRTIQQKSIRRDFPGDPLVMNLPRNSGGVGLIGELRSHMPHGQKTKTYNRSNIVTNSVKTLKMVHIKKSPLKNSICKLKNKF